MPVIIGVIGGIIVFLAVICRQIILMSDRIEALEAKAREGK